MTILDWAIIVNMIFIVVVMIGLYCVDVGIFNGYTIAMIGCKCKNVVLKLRIYWCCFILTWLRRKRIEALVGAMIKIRTCSWKLGGKIYYLYIQRMKFDICNIILKNFSKRSKLYKIISPFPLKGKGLRK